MKLLMTFFDPCGGETVNAAAEAARLVPDRVGAIEVVKLEVPTVFRGCVEVVSAAVGEYRPDAVLCLGQAAGRRQLTPERVAINIDDARIPDNAGERPRDRPIVPGGPAAYFSTLPIKAMTAAIRAAGIPAGVSNSAGTFVCNHLMYGLLHFLAETTPGVRGGFLHVPSTILQAAGRDLPGMDVRDIAAGLEAAVTAIFNPPAYGDSAAE